MVLSWSCVEFSYRIIVNSFFYHVPPSKSGNYLRYLVELRYFDWYSQRSLILSQPPHK